MWPLYYIYIYISFLLKNKKSFKIIVFNEKFFKLINFFLREYVLLMKNWDWELVSLWTFVSWMKMLYTFFGFNEVRKNSSLPYRLVREGKTHVRQDGNILPFLLLVPSKTDKWLILYGKLYFLSLKFGVGLVFVPEIKKIIEQFGPTIYLFLFTWLIGCWSMPHFFGTKSNQPHI